MKKLIEIADILSWKPCDEYNTEAKIIFATDANWPKTPVEILRLKIPVEDRFWVVMRKEIIAEKQLGLLGCDIAEHVLNCYEDVHPGDNRPRVLIETKRKWIAGEATDAAMEAAMSDAWDAARTDVWSAARDAAISAARSAVGSAPWDARSAAMDASVYARDAAWDAARSAAWDAMAAARDARAAARSAAWDAWDAARAARAAARAAEVAWQINKVIEVLEGQA